MTPESKILAMQMAGQASRGVYGLVENWRGAKLPGRAKPMGRLTVLGRTAVLRMKTRPIVTHGVAYWSVGLQSQ